MNIYQFVCMCVSFTFGFGSGMLVLIILVSDHCLLFLLSSVIADMIQRMDFNNCGI